MSFQPDSTSETRRRGSALGPAASLDDGIDTREAFDAEVNALAARALRSGGYLDLQPTPIATVEQITDDVLDQLAGAGPVNPETILTEQLAEHERLKAAGYAIVDEAMQREAAARLDAWAQTPQPSVSTGTVAAFAASDAEDRTGSERDQSGVSGAKGQRRASARS
jgi:hypothetical protein